MNQNRFYDDAASFGHLLQFNTEKFVARLSNYEVSKGMYPTNETSFNQVKFRQAFFSATISGSILLQAWSIFKWSIFI